MVLLVRKDVEAGAGTGIIIPITENLAHDHHKDSVKAAGIIMVISMAFSYPPQTFHLMPHNLILMTNIRNVPNIGMTMKKMSNRVMVTIRMWVTNLLRTSKQL